jgi:hypothetical protein
MPASNNLQNAPIEGKGILTLIQKTFLSIFAQLKDQSHFYLTGGTALAEYYSDLRKSD